MEPRALEGGLTALNPLRQRRDTNQGAPPMASLRPGPIYSPSTPQGPGCFFNEPLNLSTGSGDQSLLAAGPIPSPPPPPPGPGGPPSRGGAGPFFRGKR